ncbi:hypothetical protein ABZV34_32845 [Streptomyces sp. NPDC005195]|uniref:hypothetical protein n=1 Tax=Streptomyces sp. NPDC005195 TaxID=3154561 RepID=UPI0033AFA13F
MRSSPWVASRPGVVSGRRRPPTDGAPVDGSARVLAEVPRTHDPALIAVPEEYP